MNRKQRRANQKAHRIALKRTQKFAKKLALKRGRSLAEADMEASLVSLAFKDEFWHPETPMGESVENLSKGFSS
ncbi:MAG: hypothetical protein AAGF93_10920 [Cyanobacteria bacterium P01_H01_bin.105]